MSEKNDQSSCAKAGCGANAAKNLQDSMIESSLDKITHKILVMSGKGGVGKSSISANLAVGLADRGYQVGLLDVDIHGPSIAGIMGIEGLLDITVDRFIIPKAYNQNLAVVSMQSLMQEADQAVIWRGPAKANVIRQFVADVQWGTRDFLIIDAPPGTGDEPLSVAQTIKGAKALIVTTPQQVALADVRKSINFCKRIEMQMIGLIENMGPFGCPHCGEQIALFQSGGGIDTAQKMGVDFLGSLPFDPDVVTDCDRGTPIADHRKNSGFVTALNNGIDLILDRL